MAILAVKAASMGAGASGERAAGAEKSAAGYAFSFDDLLAEAKRRAVQQAHSHADEQYGPGGTFNGRAG